MLPNVLAILNSGLVVKSGQDTVKYVRTVKVTSCSREHVSFNDFARDFFGGNVSSQWSFMLGFVKAKELKRLIDSGNQAWNVTCNDTMSLLVVVASSSCQIGARNV